MKARFNRYTDDPKVRRRQAQRLRRALQALDDEKRLTISSRHSHHEARKAAGRFMFQVNRVDHIRCGATREEALLWSVGWHAGRLFALREYREEMIRAGVLSPHGVSGHNWKEESA